MGRILVQTLLGTQLSLRTQSCYKARSDLEFELVSSAAINIGLVMLLDSGPKLAVGE